MTRTFIAALCLSASVSTWGATAEQSLISRGEYLARAGDCIACHTAKDGKAFTGGLPLGTPIGTIYSTNITPDPETGIGKYSFEAFDDAVRRGIRSDGATLYPAMPYPSYATVTNDDMHALYAYFMKGVVAVDQPNKDSEIPWPLSMRFPLAGWRWLFAPAPNTATVPHPSDPAITRGAYLVEGLGHCGTCHTPKNVIGGDKNSQWLEGFVLQNWNAPDITSDPHKGIGRWSEDDIVAYLKTGANQFDMASGPMAEVVEKSTQHFEDADLKAIAVYLKDSGGKTDTAVPTPIAQSDPAMKAGAAIFSDRCQGCHITSGAGIPRLFPRLANAPLVNADDPTSLIRVVLAGSRPGATDAVSTSPGMPSFAWNLSDADVANVLTYVRNSWGNSAPAVTQNDVSTLRKNLEE